MTGVRPPKWSEHILEWLLPADELHTPVGDFEELFHEIKMDHGPVAACWWYRWQIVRLMPARILTKHYWGLIMLRSYLLVALRNLRRHLSYSFINIVGLATGMACFLLIMLFVRQQMSFDAWHADADRIHRVIRSAVGPDGDVTYYSSLPYGMGQLLVDDFPEFDRTVRVLSESQVLVRPGLQADEEYYESDLLLAEPSFFDVFSFKLEVGDPATALDRPDGIILTRRLARKYFPDGPALGRTLHIDNQYEVEVTGIAADPPEESTIRFSMLASLEAPYGRRVGVARFVSGDWRPAMYTTYVRTAEGADPAAVGSGLSDYLNGKVPTDLSYFLQMKNGEPADLIIEPLTDSYLRSPSTNLIGPVGNPGFLFVFASVAVLVLIVAAFNYMNMATARSSRRAREVGMRRVVGAGRGQISGQFLGEALLICLLALPPAILMVELALPLFNNLLQSTLDLDYFGDAGLVGGLLAFIILLGLLSGSYPAVFMSRFKPVVVLKGMVSMGRADQRLRKGLVVMQFAISTGLIVSTVIIERQLDYLRTKDLGLEAQQLLVVPLRSTPALEQSSTFKQMVLGIPGVQSATLSNGVPTRTFAGGLSMKGQKNDIETKGYTIDDDFLATYDISLEDGRSFRESMVSGAAGQDGESVRPVLINQTGAAELAALDRGDVLGGRFFLSHSDVEVIGIVKDFHTRSLHDPIEAMLLSPAGEEYDGAGYLSIRINSDRLTDTMEALGASWASIAPDHPFDWFFMDDAFDGLYRSEDRLARLFEAFSFIAIVIACLGLFGLAAFTAEQRTKEVGVRKVLGAGVGDIVVLLSKEFMLLVLAGFVVAAPLALFAVSGWMDEFAYHTDMSPWIFVGSGLGAMLLALVTVSFQSVRAALADPVRSLRYE